MYLQVVQQFEDPFWVNCNFAHGSEEVCAFGEDFSIGFACGSLLKMSIINFCSLRVSVFKIPFSLTVLIPNASFLNDFTNDQNFFAFSFFLGDDAASESNHRSMINYILSLLCKPNFLFGVATKVVP